MRVRIFQARGNKLRDRERERETGKKRANKKKEEGA